LLPGRSEGGGGWGQEDARRVAVGVVVGGLVGVKFGLQVTVVDGEVRNRPLCEVRNYVKLACRLQS
jgi:hypothetical protein